MNDELLKDVALYIVKNNVTSINKLIMIFNVGFNRMDKIFRQLEELKIITPINKQLKREILVNEEELLKILNK